MNESLHHHLSGQRTGDRRVLPARQQGHREQRTRPRRAQQRAQQFIGILNRRDIEHAPPMKHRRRHNQNGRIHKQRHRQRQRRVHIGKKDGLALALRRPLVIAALHNRRMQIQIVRHHRRAQNADSNVEHVGIGNDRR